MKSKQVMDISVHEACRLLEAQGALCRRPGGNPDGLAAYVRALLGDQIPADLEAL